MAFSASVPLPTYTRLLRKTFVENLMAWPMLRVFIVVLLASSLHIRSEASGEEGVPVTYGSVLKLMHGTTRSHLHCFNIRYNPGNDHYVVAGCTGVAGSNSYWVVKPAVGLSKQGDTIPNGSIIRLQHMQTQNWLHSRSQPSPLSSNMQVSCRNGQDENTGDLWRLEFIDKSKVWTKDQKVRLKHVDTGSFLHSHQKEFTQVLLGQLEVCGVMEEGAKNIWTAAEGVYIETLDLR